MAARHELGQLAAEFAVLWETGDTPPDVFAFLRDVADPTHQDTLAALLVDQSHRWQTEQPLSVEEYLKAFPDLASDQDAKIKLAVGEFKARSDSGQSPSVEAFVARFADLGDSLRSRLSSAPSAGHEPVEAGDKHPVTTTETHQSASTASEEKIGRYRLVRILGEGGFGRVWLAHDDELARYVAIKVPTPERMAEPEHAEQYLSEARTLASLDHPNLVPVYDVGRTDDGSCYVVYKFIEGSDLAARIREDRPSFSESAELIATVAGALHHAHERRLVHRDVKPGNILVETTGTPYVADFGLALREEDFGKGSGVAGTPAYMSPEQASGEGHRLDGRSDIFSLGVVLYELLTGRRPFRGSSKLETLQRVITTEPPPPREIDENIPSELERICLKALAKRASDRYATSQELAEDLIHWKSGPVEEAKQVKIVPRGLRSFDAEDADFFLELLPGPRDREGLPESIRFWRSRIEETDPDKTFTVGLMYGPSGCGKSSLVKAGLLPRLADHVIPVYVEATPEETETRILRGLRKHVSSLPDDLGLVETFTALRRGSGKKVVVVLDQFEQWLHAKRNEENTELVAALRQCDGRQLQCVVMVRDDFWLAISRFMDELDLPLVQNQNFGKVDLFDLNHARKVLAKFGQAFDRIPDQSSNMAEEQWQFLDTATSGLTQDGKVVCVRLALFAEMVKGKPWTPGTLEAVGGTEGIGVSFLEEAFSSRTANPRHRLHQQAARGVLKALLPEHGTDIKGSMRLQTELREASGYRSRPRDFDDLLRILDGDIRLITPTDPEGATTDSGRDPSSKCYQLTHDYLVPSLREWLTRKQKETRRGQAELRLAERAALWNAKPENRHLPSWREWASVRWLTDSKKWSLTQREMMRRSGRYHGARAAILVLFLAATTFAGLHIRGRVVEDSKRQRAEGLVETLLSAEIEQVPGIVRQLTEYRQWADPKLKEVCESEEESSKEHLHTSLALLPVDPSQVDYLKGRLVTATPDEVPILRDALLDHKDRWIDTFWRDLEIPSKKEKAWTLQLASALATYDPDSERWEGVAGPVTDALVSVNPMLLAKWASFLQPVRASLLPHLVAVYRNRDGKHSETEQSLATNILEDYAADQPETLADLVMDAEPKQFAVLYPKLAQHQHKAVALLEGEIDRELKPKWKAANLDPSWTTPDASLIRQIESANGLVEERFALCQTMPLDDFAQVAEKLRASGYRPTRFRPYAVGDSVQVAAVWTRDGREWQLAHSLSADEIRKRDEELQVEGVMPIDVAGYIATPVEHYAAVWGKRATDEEDARMYVAVSDAEHTAVDQAIKKEGFEYQQSLQAFRGLDGQQKYCGVRTKTGGTSTFTRDNDPHTYEGKEYLDKTQWDIDVSNAGGIQTTNHRWAQALAKAEEKLKSEPDDPTARYTRAAANYHLGNDEQALEDFDFLIEKDLKLSSRYQRRAVLHARMGTEEAAKSDSAKFNELSKSDSSKAYLDAVVAAHLGEGEKGMKRLETGVAVHSSDSSYLYDAACAYSIASKVVAEDEPAKSNLYADRAVSLLKEAVANGYNNYSHMQTDPDLDPIHDHPGYQELLSKGQLDHRYAAVWQVSAEYESAESHGLLPKDHVARCQEFLAQDYRPVAISVAAIGEDRTPVTASVWQRPIVSEEAKESLAERQANAAVALLRMGQGEKVWPLLKHSPDPRVRSWIIHRLSPMGADFEAIVNWLAEGFDVSLRRALILSLGEYDDVPSVASESLTNMLLGMYRDDPDPGIHGATEWLLRRWNQEEKLNEIDDQTFGKVEGERQWYINSQGQTMVVISGPVEFLMGSPGTEAGRQSLERLHRRRIGRSFAIATKEVTVEQFQEFLRKNFGVRHIYTKEYAPELDCPQTAVTWYAAAAYCNWLSKQEGIAEDQWCYLPIGERFAEGMKLPPDLFSRTGYRLPTEAEWDYACRALASTSRYYGQSEDLLGKYAWYADTANNRSWPVASLKPNDWGLFDMHGNVWEWCQERYSSYSFVQGSKPAEDAKDTQAVQDKKHRVVRGGSFLNQPRFVRSAYRNSLQPTHRNDYIGFRPARTHP